MNQPTQEQISEVIDLISISINDLINRDSDIFDIYIDTPQSFLPEENILNRELHEITINHRLAVYLEKHILESETLNHYNIDIEYNRYYNNQKMLHIDGCNTSVRPDIIVHTRMIQNVGLQHYLVIETKKKEITQHDINKIMDFIENENYNYLFGLTISYCGNLDFVLANLYFHNGTYTNNIEIKIPKVVRNQ